MKINRKLLPEELNRLSSARETLRAALTDRTNAAESAVRLMRHYGEVAATIVELEQKADGTDFDVIQQLAARKSQLELLGSTVEKAEKKEQDSINSLGIAAKAAARVAESVAVPALRERAFAEFRKFFANIHSARGLFVATEFNTALGGAFEVSWSLTGGSADESAEKALSLIDAILSEKDVFHFEPVNSGNFQ